MSEIHVQYKVDLKDLELCLGCPFAYVKEKGIDYSGGCDCAGDTLWDCHCPNLSKTRNKDKDKWSCKAYRVSCGQGQIPRRNKKCLDISR